jgi:DNA-binding NarL/FixJ family response regulator
METNASGRDIAVIDQCTMSAVGLEHLFAIAPFSEYRLHLFKNFNSFKAALSQTPFFSVIYSLSDVREERRNCLVSLRELALTHSGIQRIILAADDVEARLIGQLTPSRLHGIISKSASLAELQKLLIILLSETERVNNNAFAHWQGSLSRMLSPMERAIMRHLSAGLSIPEIAEQLKRNIKTVRAHKYNVMVKLGVSSDVGLLHAADILGQLPMRELKLTDKAA